MIPTQDPAYTATRLLRIANKAGKPVRIFLGIHPHQAARQLVAVDDASNLTKTGPRAEITVHQDMHPDTLAASLIAQWAVLQPQVPAFSPAFSQQRFYRRARA